MLSIGSKVEIEEKKQEDFRNKDSGHAIFEVPMFRFVAEMLHSQSASQSAAHECNQE